MIDVVRNMGMEAPAWLDSGCGTGTLAVNTLKRLPEVRFTLCDPSENMLEQSKAKLQDRNVRFLNVSSDKLEFNNEFDVVSSVNILWSSYLQAGFWAIK